jgi:hypothetical protein
VNQLSNVVTVNLEQLERCIRIAWAANVPVAEWGRPGYAKSSIAAQLTRSLQWKMYDIRLTLYEPCDLAGVYYPKDGVCSILPPDWLPFEGIVGDLACVLFLDEFDRAEPQMQNTALQLIQDRRVHDRLLSPSCWLILAGNGTTDALTFALSEAAATRMCHLYIDHASDKTRQSWQRWAGRNDVSSAMRAFAEYRWSEFHNGETDYRDNARLNLRTAVMADRLMAACDEIKRQTGGAFKTDDIELPLVSGCIGRGPATQYLAIRRAHAAFQDIDALLASPETAKVPGEISEVYALTCALLDRVRSESGGDNARDVAERIVRFAVRLPAEIAASAFRQLTERCPSIVTDANYLAWCQQNAF